MRNSKAIPLRIHGGMPLEELARLGIEPQTIADLSTNLSPFGAHPDVLRRVRDADLHAYPDPHAGAAKSAVAHAIDEDAGRIVLGNGSVELLWSLVGLLGERERPLLVVSPTFSEPEAAARAQGFSVAYVAMRDVHGFAFDTAAIAEAIESERPFAVYLCQPNNPTGTALEHAALADLLASLPRVPFIVDEAFLSLSTQHADALRPLPQNAIRVRSLTKDHGLAGLRVGYAVGAPELVRQLEARRPPWSVSTPAQVAISAAMAHAEHVASVRSRLLELKTAFEQALRTRGLRTLPSVTGFFLAETPGREHADALRDRLLREQGVLVRSAASFGLPHYIRLPACLPHVQQRLFEGLFGSSSREWIRA
jgi:histidinol-phosphate/aromatic aminotransferase/cobyric acid decarboxylase-like protein